MTTTTLSLQLESLNSMFDYELTKVNTQDRADVKQDALMKIFIAAQKQQISNLKAFARTVVKRTVIDYYRRRNRLIEQHSFSVNFNDGVDVENGGSSVECFCIEEVDYKYDIACIRADYESNINSFTAREQEVINYLLYNDEAYGMGATDLANQLGINKSHASRAVKKLREICI